MLPFLKHNKEASISMEADPIKRKSDNEEADYDMLESAAEDLIHALHSKDIKAVCSALRAAFGIYDSEPHEEGEPI